MQFICDLFPTKFSEYFTKLAIAHKATKVTIYISIYCYKPLAIIIYKYIIYIYLDVTKVQLYILSYGFSHILCYTHTHVNILIKMKMFDFSNLCFHRIFKNVLGLIILHTTLKLFYITTEFPVQQLGAKLVYTIMPEHLCTKLPLQEMSPSQVA